MTEIVCVVLAHPVYNERIYFSENALLPGLVTGTFNQDRAAVSFLQDLQEENKKYPGHAPFPWLEAQLRQMGLEVYQQEFSLSYPLANTTFTGTNLYAILHGGQPTLTLPKYR